MTDKLFREGTVELLLSRGPAIEAGLPSREIDVMKPTCSSMRIDDESGSTSEQQSMLCI